MRMLFKGLRPVERLCLMELSDRCLLSEPRDRIRELVRKLAVEEEGGQPVSASDLAMAFLEPAS